jgi:hypothetical protein
LHDATTPEARARKSSLERALAAKVGNCNQRWFYGFVWKVEWTLEPDQIDMLRRALEHPSWRHLTTVGFGMTEADEVLGVIGERPRPCWRSLTVNAYGAVDFDLWSVLPRITTVELKGSSISIGRPSPTLTSLKLDGELRFADLEPLLDGVAPNLQSLTLLRPLHPALLAGLVKSRIPSLTKLVLRHPGEAMARLLREVYPFATLIAPVG